MCEITLSIPDESMPALADSPGEAGKALRMLAAVKLFELKKLSSGAAARLAGVPRVEFLQRLGDYGVPVFDMTDEDFERETRLPELICDTSVLSALHQVGLLPILGQFGRGVTIPTAVEQELQAGRSAGYDVPDVANLGWIAIRQPKATPVLPTAEDLGPGESAVLWLALETPGGTAVLDDNAARRAAGQLGLPFTGTLGLLVDAKQRGLIETVGPVLDELERCHFHTSRSLRDTILRAAGESPS